MPKRLTEFHFSSYQPGMEYGERMDNAFMSLGTRAPKRSDLSMTLGRGGVSVMAPSPPTVQPFDGLAADYDSSFSRGVSGLTVEAVSTGADVGPSASTDWALTPPQKPSAMAGAASRRAKLAKIGAIYLPICEAPLLSGCASLGL